MAKLSGAELKQQGDVLKDVIGRARKKPHNFAMLIGKDGLVLETDLRKAPAVLRRLAKANGGGAKGATGVMNVSGKIVALDCEDDNVPAALPKLAKKHFSERGLVYKILLNLPGGETLDDGEEESPEAQPQERAALQTDEPATPERRKATPQADSEAPAAEVGAQEDNTAAVRAALIAGFKALGPSLKQAVAAADAETSKKITQLAKAFAAEVKGDDLSRASKIFSLLKTMVGDVQSSEPAPATGGSDTGKPEEEEESLLDKMKDLSGKIGDAIEEKIEQAEEVLEEAIDELKETAEDTAQAIGDAIGVLSEADEKQKARLSDTGLSDGDQLRLVQRNRDDPKAIERALAALAPMKAVNVPPSQRLRLIDLNEKSPKLFESAIAALKSLDAKGEVDVSPKAITASLKNIGAIQKERAANAGKWKAQNEKTKTAKAGLAAKQATEVEAKKAADAAAAAIAAFKKSLPDVKKMSDAERAKFAAESRKLINANEVAKGKLQAAKTATAGALTASQAAEAALTTCYDAWKATDDKQTAAQAAQKSIDDKRGLIDAISFGPLSPDATKPMDPATAQKFVDAYTKDPGLAAQAIELAGDSEDPSVLAANIGMVCDKFTDGFADKDGKKLAGTDDDRRLMAQNALKMGARLGDDYFKGFSAYLESGEQHKTDPCGGASSPARGDAETARKNAVNLKRTGMMADALLGDDGKVDVTSDKAKAAMEHMLYHPGSLQTPSPAMTDQMQKVMKTFSDPKTAVAAQKVITDVRKPTNGGAKSIVRGTVGKETGELTDNDTRQAVLSAMMTPLAQGPVGSCFTTAPARKIRESDPVEAMKSFAEIATTGNFTPKVGDAVPANANLPKGENPLMRSWEYSAATAAARLRNSVENRLLNDALMGGNVAGKDLNGIKDIVGAEAWRGKGRDPKTNKIDSGVKGKIQSALKQQLKFFYNAGPRVGDVDGGGGGDGKSTDGGYEIIYNNKALKSEADFLAAIQAIALGAAGEDKDSDNGKAIIALVSDPAFKESIFKAYTAADKDYKPWDLVSGGFEDEATKVLSGGTQRRRTIIGKKGILGGDEGDRTRAVLDNLLTGLAGKTDEMITIGTGGKNAAHAFNALPNHPTIDKIKGPDSDKKIKELLLDPGKKIASTEMPAVRAGALFEKQIRKLSDGWGWRDRDLLTAALDKRPTEDMTPGELNKLIQSVLKDFEEKQVERRLADWKKKEEAKGNTVSSAKIDEKKVDLTKDVGEWVSGGIDTMLVDEFDPPEVVIADTNWGGPADQKYFVIAPDPSTGELRMWEKGAFSGKMTPKGENWIDGDWTKLE